jgi:hypothetical protein
MRPSSRGYFFDQCRELLGRGVRLVFVGVRFGQLVGWQVVIGETGERRVGVQDLERVGVVDEQADRQVSVEFLQKEKEKVGGVRVRARWLTCRAVRASRTFVQG